MSKTFIVPDMHGNWKLALGLLEQEGIAYQDDDEEIRRLDTDTRVVQLGDLVNAVRSSVNDDISATRLVGNAIDIVLIGNHEHPYFGGPAFDGFAHFYELQHALQGLNNRGLIQAAIEVDGILLTHAGVTRDIDQIEDWENPNNKALEVADALNILWKNKEYQHAMFSTIGQLRGGRHPLGGILWSDWREPKSALLPQIVGHSVGSTWRANYSDNDAPGFMLERPYEDATPAKVQTLCIDIGAGKKASAILGAWIDEGKVTIVEYRKQD